MTDKILTFEEYTMNDDFSSKHRIDEMATISRPTDNIPRKSKVIVYGENDEQGAKTPHFHVQIDNGEIELEIKFEHIKNMDIYDLIINTGTFNPEEVSEIILTTLKVI